MSTINVNNANQLNSNLINKWSALNNSARILGISANDLCRSDKGITEKGRTKLDGYFSKLGSDKADKNIFALIQYNNKGSYAANSKTYTPPSIKTALPEQINKWSVLSGSAKILGISQDELCQGRIGLTDKGRKILDNYYNNNDKPAKVIEYLVKFNNNFTYGNKSEKYYPPTPDSPGKNKGYVHYKVKKGDVLSIIAKKYNVSIQDIKNLNANIRDINALKIGQEIKLPVKQDNTYGIELKEYRVKSGDTFSTIAQRYNVSQSELEKYNPHLKNISKLSIGDKILIPNRPVELISYKPEITHDLLNDSQLHNMIKEHEGIRFTEYSDSKGISTVAIGLNIADSTWHRLLDEMNVNYKIDPQNPKKVTLSRKLTTKEVDFIFKATLESAINDAKAIFPDFDKLPVKAQRVVVDMAFNLGRPRLKKFRQFRKAVNTGDFKRAAQEITESNIALNRATELSNIMLSCCGYPYSS